MGIFFIDTQSGQVATARQLVEAGVTTAANDDLPPRPWHRIQGTGDATTLWYAVMRKQTRGIFIGTLVIRHSDHHASLLADGWDEVEVEEIRASGPGSEVDEEAQQARPWP
ncbi:MAG TPA: hypothetical protein VK501_24665 [Baekduia sp.]|uniref:hypothetical protein n=1 Tax=Baekduia sp. TaxID=2600305 RepID=UPI002CB97595|nr:hypothetical protein [Baekduia sp.]HMJ37121.1 hypothetical protein [Baekduia sp.]